MVENRERGSLLRWEPWKGARYHETRLLIVGESHYYNQTMSSEEMEIWLKDREYTMQTVREYPLLGRKAGWQNRAGRRTNPTWDNLFRVLCGSDLLDASQETRRDLIDRFAFINLVQRPMNYTRNNYERPKADDFRKGLEVFFLEVLPDLQPRRVLFVGVTAARFMSDAARQCGVKFSLEREPFKINRVVPIRVWVHTYACEMLFMRHPGRCFSWRKWRDYLADFTFQDYKTTTTETRLSTAR